MIKLVCVKAILGKLIINNIYSGYHDKICLSGKWHECYRVIDETGWVTSVTIQYLMPYNDWLALEREKQIKSILDE
jgi:hypothetical protein